MRDNGVHFGSPFGINISPLPVRQFLVCAVNPLISLIPPGIETLRRPSLILCARHRPHPAGGESPASAVELAMCASLGAHLQSV